jgi:hypothetical protein
MRAGGSHRTCVCASSSRFREPMVSSGDRSTVYSWPLHLMQSASMEEEGPASPIAAAQVDLVAQGCERGVCTQPVPRHHDATKLPRARPRVRQGNRLRQLLSLRMALALRPHIDAPWPSRTEVNPIGDRRLCTTRAPEGAPQRSKQPAWQSAPASARQWSGVHCSPAAWSPIRRPSCPCRMHLN